MDTAPETIYVELWTESGSVGIAFQARVFDDRVEYRRADLCQARIEQLVAWERSANDNLGRVMSERDAALARNVELDIELAAAGFKIEALESSAESFAAKMLDKVARIEALEALEADATESRFRLGVMIEAAKTQSEHLNELRAERDELKERVETMGSDHAQQEATLAAQLERARMSPELVERLRESAEWESCNEYERWELLRDILAWHEGKE